MKKQFTKFKRMAAVCLLLPLSLTTQAETQERLVTAGSSITELVVALGAGSQIVAVDSTSKGMVAAETPILGYHRMLSAENIIALRPTKVIGSVEIGPPETLNLLKQSGVDVVVAHAGEQVSDLKLRVQTIAKNIDHISQGAQLLATIEDKMTAIKALRQKHGLNGKKILFLLFREGPPSVAGDQTAANTVIELMGGQNPAKEKLSSYKPMSLESVLALAPDMILISDRSYQSFGGMDGLFKAFPLLAATPAGQKKAIYTIDGHALSGSFGLKSLDETLRLMQLMGG